MPPTAAKSLRCRIAEFFKFVHFVAITAYVNGFTQLKLFRLYIENTGVFVLLQRTIQPKKKPANRCHVFEIFKWSQLYVVKTYFVTAK